MMAWFAAKAAVFDLDDTLLDWSGAQHAGLQRAFEDHLGHRDPAEVHRAFDQVLAENFAAFRRTGRWWYARDRFERLTEILDEAPTTGPMVDTFTRTVEAGLELLPGAVDALRSARDNGLAVGLLTNGPVPFQRDKFDGLGIAGHFDHVGISGEIGHWKPDAAAFHHVLDALGVVPEDAVMVGDSPDFDLDPARRLGMRTVHIHRQGGCGDVDVCAPHPAGLVQHFQT